MTKRLVLSLVFVSLLTLASTAAFGQAVFGSVFGTVTDPQGAAVPNATVTVTDVAKGTSDTATTNESGNYTVTHLIPDTYSVKVEAAGFKTFEQQNVPVRADFSNRVDAALTVGATSETLEVTSQAPQLQTASPDVATEFNERYVTDLPIFNRNFTSLELLAPGTQLMQGWNHAATENPQGSLQIFVNGQHFSGTAFQLDGTDNQDPILGIIVINPNLDSVTEAKVALQDYDAEMGKAVAGFVTSQTKSGSNELHGTGFWFYRSQDFLARDPYTQYAPNSVTGRYLPDSRWQQFGGSVGGPIIKNKLFFFGDYQGTRQTVGQTNQLTVPTTLAQTTCSAGTGFCNLSQYLNGPFGNGQVYNPVTRTPYAGNLIPVSDLSALGQKLFALYPGPTNGGLQNNFVASGSGPYNQNAFDARIDWAASQTINVFGRFSLDYFNLSGEPSFGQAAGGVGFGLGGLAGSSITHNYSLASGVTKTFSPTFLGDFRFGWFRYNPMTHKFDEGTNPMTALGIPGLNMGNIATSGLPYFNMDSQVSDFGTGLGVARCNCPLIENENEYQWVANFTKIHNNHTFKFGVDYRYATNLRVPSDQNRTGELTFSHLNTSDGTNDGTGLSMATLLFGNVTAFDRYVSSSLNASERQNRLFLYGQDTWRVNAKLTVNLGLRWEDYFPESVNAAGNGGFGNLTEGIIRVAGYGPYGLNGNISNKWNAFAPRLGASYSITDRTVFRVGFGTSYDMGVFGSNFGHAVTQNLPVLVSQQLTATNNNPNPAAINNFDPAFNLVAGPPAYVFPAIPSNGQFPLQGPTGTVSPRVRPLKQTLPMVNAFNVTLQHQLTRTMTVSAAYVGNTGYHGFAGDGPTYNVNQPYATSDVGGNGDARPYTNRFSYPGYIVNGQVLTCCSQDIGNYFGNNANSRYNSLQVTAKQQFSNGLQFQTFFTWSKAQHYDSNYFADDPRYAWGQDDQNRGRVWVTNFVYQLPFGKGQKYASNVNRATELAIGGWQITGTYNWSSGLPFTAGFSGCPNINSAAPCRPTNGPGNMAFGVGSFNPATHTSTFFTPELASNSGRWVDPTQFGYGYIGNAGFDTLYGPSDFTGDMSAMKNFNFTERWKLQFRTDFFNVFNHAAPGFSQNQNGGLCVAYNPSNVCGGNNGKITDILYGITMRQVQFGLHLFF